MVIPVKALAGCVLLLISSVLYSQNRYDWRSEIDQIIQETDSLSLKSQRTFSLYKPYHSDKDVRETWFYTLRNGRVIIFEIEYVIDSMEYTEVYYLHNNRLICMEQYEAPYLSVYADQLKHGEAYFFDGDALKQYVKTGRDRPNPGLWATRYESISRFQQRYAELQRHMKYLR